MNRLLFISLLFAACLASAQSKKPLPKTAKPIAKEPVEQVDTADLAREDSDNIPKEFAAYTKRSKIKPHKMKLCINLVSPENIFNHCVNDSLCRDPEVFKILFEKKQGDTTYVLVYVRAFSKPDDRPSCDAGKEVKLFFVRWSTKTNKALVKQKTIESCMRNITNMTKELLDEWDGKSPFIFKYHRGGQNYVDLKFDPQNYLVGLQSTTDN